MAHLTAVLLIALLAAACAAGDAGSNTAVLQLPTDADAGVAALAYTVYPSTNGTLPAGKDLMQAERLYSPGGSVFLVPQTDGNLVLYNAYAVAQLGHTAASAAIWQSGTFNSGGPQPYTLAMQQDCNLVLYNGKAANNGPRNQGDAVFFTATYNQGVPPCSLVVSDAGGGGFAVVDSTGSALFSNLRVLATDGLSAAFSGTFQGAVAAFVFDAAARSWASIGTLLPNGPGPSTTMGYPLAQTRLHTGSILLAGGTGNVSNPTGPGVPQYSQVLRNASLFSPATLTFAYAGYMATPRSNHQLLTAFDGSALAIGGGTDTYGSVTDSIERFDGTAWSRAGTLLTARTQHLSIVLSSGQVLSTGGTTAAFGNPATASAELFDPIGGTSTAAGSMSSARISHRMVLLADGTVLACGGEEPGQIAFTPTYLFTCDLFTPSTRSWQPTGNMTRRAQQAPGEPGGIPWINNWSLSLLPNGQVLASGPPGSLVCAQFFNLYDPQTRAWSEVGPAPVSLGSQILLPTGELLLSNAQAPVNTGAQCQFPGTPVTVLYNPITQSTKVTGDVPGSNQYGQYTTTSEVLF